MNRVYVIIFSLLFLSTQINSQCTEGDCYSGEGVFVFNSGAKYSGKFREGKIDEYGILEFSDGKKYEGEWRNQMRHGKGKLNYPNGNVYFGHFQENVRSGYGKIIFHTGDSYEGHWKNDQPSGEGAYYFKSGHKYKGSFVKGMFEGYGTMYYNNGAKFEGNWKESKKHGKGTYTDPGGTKIEDTWINGERASEAKPDSLVIGQNEKSSYRNCNKSYCQNGIGRYTYKDGSYYVGEFKDGLPFGKGKTYYRSGDFYEGYWKYNAPHGNGKMRFSSGVVVNAEWNMGYPKKRLKSFEPQKEYVSNQPKPRFNEEVKIWTVIVGVASYNHLPTLKYTDDDAYQIYAFLKSPEGGAIPDERIALLIDEAATNENIVHAMDRTFSQADENDVIMMYYSGHGLPGSFLPYDYNGYQNVLDHHTVRKLFENSAAKHKVVFADACHSGSLLASRSPFNSGKMESFFNGIEESNGGTALFTSSKSEEISLETTGLRQGIFSHFLIKGLAGEANKDGNNFVTIGELYNYVYSNVLNYTSGRQHPSIAGDFDEDMPLSVIR